MTESNGNAVSFLRGLSAGARAPSRSPPALLAGNVNERQSGAIMCFLECLGAEAAREHTGEWADLAGRALESNVFYEPGFALNAATHLPNAGKPNFLFCWESRANQSRFRLLGVWPLLLPRSVFPSLARGWRHDYGCCCAPLLDRAAARFVLDRMLLWLRDRYPLGATETPLLATNKPVHAAARDHARRFGLAFDLVEQYERAALDASVAGVCAGDFISAKKRKELRRQLRRLRDLGPVAFGESVNGDDLRERIEAFMLMEHKGWKGRAGDAFLGNAGLASFLRATGETLGREGKFRIYWLALDQKMIAGNIVLLNAQGGAYFWKTAYDEDYGFASPGVLLTMHMTDRLLEDSKILSVDSCALADHPMIDHVWRGRLSVSDTMLANAPNRGIAFSGLLHKEKLLRSIRKKAKTVLARIKARR